MGDTELFPGFDTVLKTSVLQVFLLNGRNQFTVLEALRLRLILLFAISAG